MKKKYKEGDAINGFLFIKDVTKPSKKRRGIFICPHCLDEFESDIGNIKINKSNKCRPCVNKSMDRSSFGKTHGLRNHPLYSLWINMKHRCKTSTDLRFKSSYYDKGITVCEEWINNAENFYNWSISNGWESGLTIDRIDNSKGYSPDNCRWTTYSINNRNRDKSKNTKSSPYIGVGFNKRTKKWKSYIRIDKKEKFFGYFEKIEDALKARNDYIQENNLEGFKIQELNK